MNNTLEIKTEFITLGQLLKKAGFVSTGGQSKFFIETNEILINGEKPIGRSTRIFPGQVIFINNEAFLIEKENA